ncbi:ComEC/Rec2 family competence protein [Cohnella caldifontis]|uniref:ComEC/Rec2 family competence protein n=1 Tax=Cohnella caldifontis TaxID=3027471 RepID=UPI0023EBB645|nr:ComEC/Rec2 family competence protein [Cohnella sp. YIM B05605]
MDKRPLAAFAGCWLIGVTVPSWFAGVAGQAAALAGLLLILLGGALSGRLSVRLACACAAALLLAFAESSWAERTKDSSDLSALWPEERAPETAELRGRMKDVPDVDGDTVTFRLAAVRVKARGETAAIRIRETVQVRVKLKAEEEQRVAGRWRRGETLAVVGVPGRPESAGNFGAFDYRAYSESQGIAWTWTVQGTAGVRTEEDPVPWRLLPLRAADELRAGIGRLADRLYPNGDAGYMKGLTAGITDDIDPALYDAYSRLGLTHILAISGLHVGVVVFVLLRLGALFRLTRERSLDLAFAAMPAYMLLTGASPSAVRACLMAMIALAMARRHLLKDGFNLLAAAALVMLVWDPAAARNVSFQLSFTVTAGLLLWTSSVAKSLAFIRMASLRGALAVALTAQAVSFPLTAYYFHGVHLLSLPANLVLVPFVSFVILPLGMASVALGAIWFPLGEIPALLATYGNRGTFALVEWLNRPTALGMVWPQPSKLWVLSAYALMAVSMAALSRRRARRAWEEAWGEAEPEADDTVTIEDTGPVQHEGRPSWAERVRGAGFPAVRAWAGGFALLMLWAGWGIWGYKPAFADRSAYVQFLDVGQGDGILVRTGRGNHVLVDAGGTVRFRKPGEEWKERRDPYEVGRKLLVPLLKQRGVRGLDALMLTHLDADHIGGAQAVLDNIPVRAIVWNGTWKDSPGAEKLLQTAVDRGIPVYAAQAGMKWDIDASASMEILFPETHAESVAPPGDPALLPELDQQNESSVVTQLSLYGRRFLLTGDVEAAGERAVLNRIARAGETASAPQSLHGPVDVMKAAHHGSKTSTTEDWLAWWKPAETVISVGRNNLYGHPSPPVVDRIEASGSALYRTDRDGEIQYRVRPDGTLTRRTKRAMPPESPHSR